MIQLNNGVKRIIVNYQNLQPSLMQILCRQENALLQCEYLAESKHLVYEFHLSMNPNHKITQVFEVPSPY